MTASRIEWTGRSDWNPIRGCTRVSEGCRHCYAEAIAARFSDPGQPFEGFATRTSGGPRWTGRVALVEDRLTLPLRWRRPATIFASSTSDIFHESLSDADIDRIFAVMALAPRHIFQVLTKRAERMRAWATDPRTSERIARVMLRRYPGWGVPAETVFGALINRAEEADPESARWPLPNVWLGVSVEDQAAADARIPHLLATPAAKRFLSCEPLLGPVDLASLHWRQGWLDGARLFEAKPGILDCKWDGPRIDWVIAGGESGRGARPMHPDWARGLRDQCRNAGVPFFFKQWGEWLPIGRMYDDLGDTDETVAAETAMLEARGREMEDGDFWTDPGHVQLVDAGMYNWANEQAQPPGDVIVIQRVGKSRAGRLLDGVEHNGMPA